MRGRSVTESEAEEMRAHLTQVALRLVDTEGRDACSLRRVGVEAGISRMTPYTYFADKEALLDAVRVAALHALADEHAGRTTDVGARERLDAVIAADEEE